MEKNTFEIRIIHLGHLSFAVEQKQILKIERIDGDRAITSEDYERLNILHGADLFGLPMEKKASCIVRFIPEISARGIAVEDVSEELEFTPTKTSDNRLVLGIAPSDSGDLPVLDISAFFKRLSTVSQRRTALFDALAETRRPRARNIEAVSEESVRQKKIRAARAGRKTRRINQIARFFGSIKTRVALFLTILVLVSMSGIIYFESGVNTAFRNLWDTLWYSIVTITTVGYGDKTPITIGGKIVGLLLMGMGVIVMAAVTGQIASFLVEQQMRRREGLLKLKNLQNHFIICGWRRELDRVIAGILSVNPEYNVNDIVLINNVGHEAMLPVLNNPSFEGINYINGDFIEEETLRRANITRASRVMIIADFSQNYSQQEVDSRTVMAVLTIESITKKVYVAAELLDDKFEKYLKLANCDEIILSREYSKMILANASSASGVSHVLHELLSPQHGQGLESRDIPDWLTEQPFGRLSDYFNATYGAICIGLLENTGNFYSRKREALNEAQMTPDISKLVENLRTVKQLIPNRPVLNPGRDYIVRKNSKAIVIELSTQRI